jgi:hypothetical protein
MALGPKVVGDKSPQWLKPLRKTVAKVTTTNVLMFKGFQIMPIGPTGLVLLLFLFKDFSH